MQPWEIDPDGPPRGLTLGETLLGLEHFGLRWLHSTNLQRQHPDGTPDGPPGDGLVWLLTHPPAPLPKGLSLALRVYERELLAIADARYPPSDLPWRVAPAPPPSLEDGERALREFRVHQWLDGLAREPGKEP